jgi:hypothetical protein
MKRWQAVLVLLAAIGFTVAAQEAQFPVIEANVPTAPPGWAVLERRLLKEMSEAAFKFAERYTRSGGTLVWKTSGSASADDLPESFYNFPLLYALGGDERLKELSFRLWNATTRQLEYDFGAVHREFAASTDWFHHGEGLLYFYFLGLADPTDHETVARARRFAGLYMGEDPAAPNYDAKLKLIRSPHTGSRGPRFGDPEKARPWSYADWMQTYGLPVEGLPGIERVEDLKDPEKAARMGAAIAARQRGDVAMNLAATTLAVNAWLYTGESKYADWVREYTGAWMERTRSNGGVTPDNVGLTGKTGEYNDGKWWGGNYGWAWPHGYHSVGQAVHIAAANAMLVSGGDSKWLELPRSNLDRLLAEGKDYNGTFLVPFKRKDRGWTDFQPIDRYFLTSLWFLSQDAADYGRLERYRLSQKVDWHAATKGSYPARGKATLPEPRGDCLNCDIEGLSDWNAVTDIRNKEDRGHEGPWVRFLAGANPDYPEKILSMSYGQAAWRMRKIQTNQLQMTYAARSLEGVAPEKIDLTGVHEHHWHTVNPVTCEALVQLTLGGPQPMYNGGLLHTTLRYFDADARRPGLPPDVAALVTRVEQGRAVAQLINLSMTEPRRVIVQGGMFGEHRFTTVAWPKRVDRDPEQPNNDARPAAETAEQRLAVNGKYFEVRLPAGMGVTLDMEMVRFGGKPSYTFPWHGVQVPVR